MGWPEAFLAAVAVVCFTWLVAKLLKLPPREPYHLPKLPTFRQYKLPHSHVSNAWPWPRASERRCSADRAMAEILAGRGDKEAP